MGTQKIISMTVFNITDNHKCFLSSKSAYCIRVISEGSCHVTLKTVKIE